MRRSCKYSFKSCGASFRGSAVAWSREALRSMLRSTPRNNYLEPSSRLPVRSTGPTQPHFSFEWGWAGWAQRSAAAHEYMTAHVSRSSWQLLPCAMPGHTTPRRQSFDFGEATDDSTWRGGMRFGVRGWAGPGVEARRRRMGVGTDRSGIRHPR